MIDVIVTINIIYLYSISNLYMCSWFFSVIAYWSDALFKKYVAVLDGLPYCNPLIV